MRAATVLFCVLRTRAVVATLVYSDLLGACDAGTLAVGSTVVIAATLDSPGVGKHCFWMTLEWRWIMCGAVEAVKVRGLLIRFLNNKEANNSDDIHF